MPFENTAPRVPGQESVLTPDALAFLEDIETRFGARRRALMEDRKELQKKFDAGWTPDFLPETADIRAGDWNIRPVPAALQDRRVEITGPVDRKMIINALNSGACVFMADFEDSNTPTWVNQISGQINLRDANSGEMAFKDPASAKEYKLNNSHAVLMVRPRGLHMEERHLKLGGQYLSASFFDFGLYLFHNRKAPYFYLPKLESHHEARLWSDVLSYAEDFFKLPRGTIRVTVLIETITASFQMDEILHALKDHIVGLNCGRWDYIFSFIKKFSRHSRYVLPDRGDVAMTCHFLRSYSLNLIRTCHRRGAHAMGGMAAQIPIKNDEEANRHALDKVAADKEREAKDGHDGTWVAHPALVGQARAIFDRVMPGPNQVDKMPQGPAVTAADLLAVPQGRITEEGLRKNINVGLLYLKAWLGGLGCVPIYNLMEDAATAEISRTQLWQWRKHRAALNDGRRVDDVLMKQLLQEEVAKLADDRYLRDAAEIFERLVIADDLEDFITTPAYARVLEYEKEA